MINATIQTIDVEDAEKMLRQNIHNRNLSKKTIETYAKEIKKGNWQINGEAIKIAKNGDLLDGQHRLHAIIRADNPIESMVISGLPNEVFDTLDQGKKRNITAFMGMNGVKNAGVTASATRLLYIYTAAKKNRTIPMYKGSAGSAHDVLEFFEHHKELEDSVVMVLSLKGARVCHSSLLSFVHYLMADIDREDADEFISKLITGESLEQHHPILVLREKLIHNRELIAQKRGKVINLVFHTWNLWRAGEEVTHLRWSTNDEIVKMK